ncbi:transmembrane protein 207 isoform X2 [Pelodiscus sinensis]|uniref:transmembrane protein 207 isoform X2 n=1 Tax=Pelodiscus sinensis TaxID=13735 RepID=UPI003F6AACCD
MNHVLITMRSTSVPGISADQRIVLMEKANVFHEKGFAAILNLQKKPDSWKDLIQSPREVGGVWPLAVTVCTMPGQKLPFPPKKRLLALLLLAMTLSCGFLFCMQCWLKRRSSFPCRRTLAVFALSDADSLGEASPRAFSGAHTCPPNPELGPSTTPHAIPGGAGPPPSYEDIMKTGKH